MIAAGTMPATMAASAPPASLVHAVRSTGMQAASAVASSDACTAEAARPACPTEGKAFATLRARAALAGFTLGTMTETDGLCFYLLSRWGMSRTLPDLASVVVFLRQMGAPE